MQNPAWILNACLSVAGLLCGSAAAPQNTPSDVPESLRVPVGAKPVREVHATGVQIYTCVANKENPTRFEWVFTAPEARLRDRTGALVGRHYAGPTWEGTDGSKAVGEVIAKEAAPDPHAIPWLLLRVTASGTGIFSHTTYVQRMHTSDGKAPANGCSSTQSEQTLRVPYQADYVFYASAP